MIENTHSTFSYPIVFVATMIILSLSKGVTSAETANSIESQATEASPDARRNGEGKSNNTESERQLDPKLSSDNGDAIKTVEIRSVIELLAFSNSIVKDAGKTDDRTKGLRHRVPGLFILYGDVPGRGTKGPDVLDCGWSEFKLDRSWPSEVFLVRDERPKVRLLAKLYWYDPRVAAKPFDARKIQRSGSPKNFDVDGTYQLEPVEVWVKVNGS